MARFVPPLRVSSGRSPAESRVLNWLGRLGDEWTVLHSLGVLNHPFKRWAEVDALVIGPPGVLVLEVKGGRVARRQGIWEFTDRAGKVTRRREGPFDQAGGTHGAIRRFLVDAGALGRAQCSGYAVLLPDVTLGGRSSDVDENVLLDASSSWAAPARVLTRWSRYWAGRTGQADRLSSQDIRAVVDALRGDLDLRPALSLVADQVEEELTRLTHEQGRVLRAAAENPRLLVSGRAGTGKTVLAMAEARQFTGEGRQVLLVCTNPVLARQLARAAVGSGVEVGVYDRRTGTVSGATKHGYDAVIVDEAQDLGPSWTKLMSTYAKGGPDNGTWRLFHDPEQDLLGLPADLTNNLPSSTLRVALTLNCRNTREIAVAASLLTRTQLDVEAPVPGAEVEMRWWEESGTHASLLAAELRTLAESLPAHRIAVLTRSPLSDSSIAALRDEAGVALRRLSEPGSDSVVVATAEEFKGLEASAVIAGIASLEEPTDRRHAYVACTRARAHLTLLLHESVRGAYSEGARWFGQMLTSRAESSVRERRPDDLAIRGRSADMRRSPDARL
jgi:DNA polymerase III delta prime subunit